MRMQIEFESVSAINHPEYYRGEAPCISASQVPAEHWHKTSRESENQESIINQYYGCKHLEAMGELIRNIKLYEGTVKFTEVQMEDK